MNYTKGEWKVKQMKDSEFFDDFTLMVESKKLTIALCDRLPWDSKKERLANAHLIAAAPMLYDACDLVQRAWAGDGVDMATAIDSCLLALAKAEGKEEK